MHWGSLAAGLLIGSQTLASGPGATVTLLEGNATIVRGTGRYALAEGVRLATGDIVDVGRDGLLEIEFPDGTRLALGASSELLALALGKGEVAAEFRIATATLKHESVASPSGAYRYATAHLTLVPSDAALTAVLSEDHGAAFLESGAAEVIESGSGSGSGGAVHLKSGDFYARESGQSGTVGTRPTPEFVAALPPIFLDPLPSRMERFQDHEVAPESLGEVSYEEVAYWLEGPKALRRPFLDRFVRRVSDPAFRAAVAASMSRHPEWDPILFPEKYEPKEEPAHPEVRTGSREDEGRTPGDGAGSPKENDATPKGEAKE